LRLVQIYKGSAPLELDERHRLMMRRARFESFVLSAVWLALTGAACLLALLVLKVLR
jgi:hypothetical protein